MSQVVLSLARKKWWDERHPEISAEDALKQAEIFNVVFSDDAEDNFTWPPEVPIIEEGK